MFGAGGLFGGRSSGGDTMGMGLNTGGGSSAPGTADSAFAAWLHDQFTSRDDQMKDLTARLNELLILQKEKSTSGAGVNIAMHQGGGGGGLTEEVRIMGVESLSLLIFLGDIHIFIYIIPWYWNVRCYWYSPSVKTITFPFHLANSMAVDDLATQGARASATMILAKFAQNYSVQPG